MESQPVLVKRALAVFILLLSLIVLIPQRSLESLTRWEATGPRIDLGSIHQEVTFQSTINLPWFRYGQDFGRVPGWEWKGVSQERNVVDAVFEQLTHHGVRCLVWFLFCDGRGSPRFDDAGYVTGLDSTFWADYETAIALARKHDVSIVWVLLDYQWMLPRKREGAASLFGHADIITDSAKRASFFQHVFIPLLRRYPFEPHIAGWILINEPENAIKEGIISPDSVQTFAREAARIVKNYTDRQVVSIASANLESLLEYWSHDAIGLDFFIFHHYEPFLPPPASHIRMLMPGTRERPIFIGEFNLNKPPVTLEKFLVWSQWLGFAGAWPWSLHDRGGFPQYEAARRVSTTVEAARAHAKRFRENFMKRRQVDPESLTPEFRQALQWWIQHGASTVLPTVEHNLIQWRADSLHQAREESVTVAWERSTLAQLDTLNSGQSHKKRELAEASNGLRENQQWLARSNERVQALKKQLADYEDELVRARHQLEALQRAKAETQETLQWLTRVTTQFKNTRPLLEREEENVKQAHEGIQSCNTWIESVKAQLHQIDAEHTIQTSTLNQARAKIALHRALLNWDRYRLKWAQALYQQFWDTEITWANTAGLAP